MGYICVYGKVIDKFFTDTSKVCRFSSQDTYGQLVCRANFFLQMDTDTAVREKKHVR